MKYYIKYKNVLNFEVYLSADIFWKHKIALTRFRCSNHKLSVETSKYLNSNKDISRNCKYCDNNGIVVVEDELHFLLVCPLCNQLREKFLEKYVQQHVSLIEKLCFIMSSCHCVKDLSAFVCNAFDLNSMYTEK